MFFVRMFFLMYITFDNLYFSYFDLEMKSIEPSEYFQLFFEEKHGQKRERNYQVLGKYCFGLVGRVFPNGPGDLGLIPDRVIPKTLKMVLDTSLLNTQQYTVRIKGKEEQSRERSSILPYTLV